MEFDRSKILTVVTADQAKVGQKGWFADDLEMLERRVARDKPSELIHVYGEEQRFRFEKEISNTLWSLFYPAPELTYAERQAEWIKENNVKAGTKVRVTRTFTADEDGSCCWKHDDLVGMTGTVAEYGIASHNLGITMSDGNLRAIPYFALEVIKEPTYRLYNNDELNRLVGKVLTQKGCGYPCLVTQRYSMTQVRVNGYLYNAQQLLELFTLDGKPCGVKEEA